MTLWHHDSQAMWENLADSIIFWFNKWPQLLHSPNDSVNPKSLDSKPGFVIKNPHVIDLYRWEQQDQLILWWGSRWRAGSEVGVCALGRWREMHYWLTVHHSCWKTDCSTVLISAWYVLGECYDRNLRVPNELKIGHLYKGCKLCVKSYPSAPLDSLSTLLPR